MVSIGSCQNVTYRRATKLFGYDLHNYNFSVVTMSHKKSCFLSSLTKDKGILHSFSISPILVLFFFFANPNRGNYCTGEG